MIKYRFNTLKHPQHPSNRSLSKHFTKPHLPQILFKAGHVSIRGYYHIISLLHHTVSLQIQCYCQILRNVEILIVIKCVVYILACIPLPTLALNSNCFYKHNSAMSLEHAASQVSLLSLCFCVYARSVLLMKTLTFSVIFTTLYLSCELIRSFTQCKWYNVC